MPQIPRYTSQVAPVSSAGGVTANARSMSETGESQMWASIGQSASGALGRVGEVMFSIEKDRRDLQDKSVLMDMDTAFTVAKTRMDDYVAANPDKPDTYIDVQRRLTDEALSGIQFDKLSESAYTLAGKQAEAFSLEGMTNAQLVATKHELKNTTAKAIKGLELSIAEGNPEKIDFYKGLINGLPIQKEEASLYIADAVAAGEKMRHANLMSASKDTIVQMVESGKGKEDVDGFIKTVQDPSDRESLRDYAQSVLEQTTKQNKLAFDSRKGDVAVDLSTKMANDELTINDIDAMLGNKDEIESVPAEYRSDYVKYLEGWKGKLETRNSDIVNMKESERKLRLLQNHDLKKEDEIIQLASTADTPAEMASVAEKAIEWENQGYIKSSKEALNIARGARRTAVDEIVKARVDSAYNGLVGGISDDVARLTLREETGTISRTEKARLREARGMLQIRKHQYLQFESDVKAFKRGLEPGTSDDDISNGIASIWTRYAKKSDSQRRREFNEYVYSDQEEVDNLADTPELTDDEISKLPRVSTTKAIMNLKSGQKYFDTRNNRVGTRR